MQVWPVDAAARHDPIAACRFARSRGPASRMHPSFPDDCAVLIARRPLEVELRRISIADTCYPEHQSCGADPASSRNNEQRSASMAPIIHVARNASLETPSSLGPTDSPVDHFQDGSTGLAVHGSRMPSGLANPDRAAADKSDGDAMKTKPLSVQSTFRRIRCRRLAVRTLGGVSFVLTKYSETTETPRTLRLVIRTPLSNLEMDDCQLVFGISKQ